jgi:precorrin-4 methylase
MGTAPDLMTVRAQNIVARADILMAEDGAIETMWAVILTMGDWPGRLDRNQKLMEAGSSTVFYTTGIDYPSLFAQLKRHYPADAPVAVVADAGDLKQQRVIRSTVGRFLQEMDRGTLLMDRHMLFVGKFLNVGQARKDFLTPRAPEPVVRR